MKTENLDPEEGRMDMLSGNNSKGGYTSSHLVITSASSIVLGAAAGAAISFRSDDFQQEPPVTENVNEGNVIQEEEPAVQEEAAITQEELETIETEEERPEEEALEEEKLEEDSPEEDVVAKIQREEAERQVNSWNIDATDNDVMAFMKVEGITTVYDAEGNEVEAAFAHFFDGQRFVLADLDGDGIFDSPFNLDGTPMTLTIDGEKFDLGSVGLTRSDLEDNMNDDGGYLAPEENELAKIDENDIDEDVIDSEGDVAVLDGDGIDDDIINGTDGDVAALDDNEFDSIDDNVFEDEVVYDDDVAEISDDFNGIGIDADFEEAG